MGFFVTLAVRIALLVTLWVAWGWWAAAVALASLIFINPFISPSPKIKWGTSNFDSPVLVGLRVAIEIGVLVWGLVAANAVWGTIWAAAILIVYVIGFVSK